MKMAGPSPTNTTSKRCWKWLIIALAQAPVCVLMTVIADRTFWPVNLKEMLEVFGFAERSIMTMY